MCSRLHHILDLARRTSWRLALRAAHLQPRYLEAAPSVSRSNRACAKSPDEDPPTIENPRRPAIRPGFSHLRKRSKKNAVGTTVQSLEALSRARGNGTECPSGYKITAWKLQVLLRSVPPDGRATCVTNVHGSVLRSCHNGRNAVVTAAELVNVRSLVCSLPSKNAAHFRSWAPNVGIGGTEQQNAVRQRRGRCEIPRSWSSRRWCGSRTRQIGSDKFSASE